jgi:hypothetical protein
MRLEFMPSTPEGVRAHLLRAAAAVVLAERAAEFDAALRGFLQGYVAPRLRAGGPDPAARMAATCVADAERKAAAASAESAAASAKPAIEAAEAPAAGGAGGVSVKERLALAAAEKAKKEGEASSSPLASPSSKSPRSASALALGAAAGAAKCAICTKTVYPLETQSWDSRSYHKECFKCHQCKGPLSIKNVASINSTLYCKTHYMQIFSLKGKYSDFTGNVPAGGGKGAAAATPDDAATSPPA